MTYNYFLAQIVQWEMTKLSNASKRFVLLSTINSNNRNMRLISWSKLTDSIQHTQLLKSEHLNFSRTYVYYKKQSFFASNVENYLSNHIVCSHQLWLILSQRYFKLTFIEEQGKSFFDNDETWFRFHLACKNITDLTLVNNDSHSISGFYCHFWPSDQIAWTPKLELCPLKENTITKLPIFIF